MKSKHIKTLVFATIFVLGSVALGYAPVSAQRVSENTVDETTEVSAETAEILYSGKDGDLDWSIDSTGHLTITGTGDYETAGWLEYCSNIKSAKVDVSGITDTSHMFDYCTHMTSVDLTNLDASQVTTMECMFYMCESLTSLNMSGLDTSQVTNMGSMFEECVHLTSLDMSELDTSQVTNMGNMFYMCSRLTSLNIAGLDTTRVTDMSSMFVGCGSLTSLDVSSFDTGAVTSMWCIFDGCSSLTSLDVSNFDTSQVTDMSRMFADCSALTSLDVSELNTTQVTSMDEMFSGCSSLTGLDVSELDTSQVTSMGGMFSGSSGLTGLDVSELDTSQVTNMGRLFSGCSSLSSLDVSGLDTSQVTYMGGMFSGCSSLSSLDVSGLDTSQVTYMGRMFSGCRGLTSLDVSSLDTSQVTNMAGMFSDCNNLNSLNLSSLNTSRVTDMSEMFSGCSSLVNLDVNNIDTSQLTISWDIVDMFSGCSSLTSLDLSNFNISNIPEEGVIVGIFEDCNNLMTLKAPKSIKVEIALPIQDGYCWLDELGNIVDVLTCNLDTTMKYTKEKIVDIANATITVENQLYTGRALTPEPKVTYRDRILQKNIDYTLYYTDNINLGTGNMVILGKGKYTGTKVVSFGILGLINGSDTVVSSIANQTYTGKAITPQPKVTYGNTVLQKGQDYKLSYVNNISPGTATVIITGQGKYTGSISISFNIEVVLEKSKLGSIDFLYQKGNLAKLNSKTLYSLYLDFVPVDFAKKYEIELTNNKGKKVKTVTVNCENKDYVEKTIKNLTEEVYGVRIRAVSDDIYGEWSDKSYVIKQPRAQARTTKGNVQIKWEEISGVTGYDIYMSTKRNSGYKKVASVGKNTTIKTIKNYNKKKLKTRTYYYYVVAKKKVSSKTYKSGKVCVYKVTNKK